MKGGIIIPNIIGKLNTFFARFEKIRETDPEYFKMIALLERDTNRF